MAGKSWLSPQIYPQQTTPYEPERRLIAGVRDYGGLENILVRTYFALIVTLKATV